MNYTAFVSLRNGLILILSGIGIFVASVTAGLLTIEPPAPAPESPEHMTPITIQVGRIHPAFGILRLE